jgi:uncharacterized membrane protein
MSEQPAGDGQGVLKGLMEELPTDELMKEFEKFLGAAAQRIISLAAGKVGDATEQLTSIAENGGSPLGKAVSGAAQGKPLRGLLGAGLSGVTGAVGKTLGGGGGGGGGGNSGGKKLKVTNIVEQIDIGVPLTTTYNLWTQFEDFPTFMKKVETVSQDEDEKLTWKAQVAWSHRTWNATITEQIPDKRIIWRSQGEKGYVDGAVTFHELGDELTRVLVVLEYHPAGLMEGTGNLWRAQGRRVRLELKHFRRHIMSEVLLHPDEVEGWRGEIRDGEVVRSGDEDEGQDGEDEGQDGGDEDQDADRDEDRADEDYEDEDQDEADEDYEDEDQDEADEDEDEDEDQDQDDQDDEYDDEDYEDEDEDTDYDEDEDGEDRDEDEEPEEARDRGGGARGGGSRSRRRVTAGSR